MQFAIINCHFAISSARAAEPEFSREQIDFFEKQVRPVLAAQCWNCHGEKKSESGLRLDSREAVLKGGDRGEVVSLREASASLIVHAVRRDGELQMPPNGRLTAEQIAALTKWIELGLPWPREASGSALAQAWRTHWAFQPVMKPSVPEIGEDLWSQSPIDRFVLERLISPSGGRESPGSARTNEAGASRKEPGDSRPPLGEQSALAPRADRRTLIRRATFDLLGLPPTPDEVAGFAVDLAPDAFERLVDRLLASPKYGERWGRHWLDVARYADTKGYVFFEEKSYPWAYTYRDYVVRSLNEDKPYDQFVVEQLAADLLGEEGRTGNGADDMTNQSKNPSPPASLPARPGRGEQAEQLPALGFLTVGSHFMGNVHDIVDDRIDVVTRGLMGLTVTCARCHDHKYDPIPTADYYSLYGVFRSTTEPLVLPLFAPVNDTPDYRRFTTELSLRQQRLDDFVQQKHGALVEGARTRVGEYLLAAKAANEKPATDDFMLIADPGDLNPAMIVRWQAYLRKVEGRGLRVEGGGHTNPKRERGRVVPPENAVADQAHALSSLDPRTVAATHPVWGLWFALAALSEERFKDDAAALCSALVSAKVGDRRVATVIPSLPTDQLASSGLQPSTLDPQPARQNPLTLALSPQSRGEGTGKDQSQEQPPHPNPLPLKAGGEGTKRANSLVVKAVCGEQPPASLNEVAARYGELMKSVHLKWQAALRKAVILKRPAPERLDDPDEEELRIELYGEAAPANVPLIFGWGFLSLLPDRASQGEYQQVLKEVEQWLIGGPGSPPRAMVLNEGETFDPHIFLRGNPHRLGDAVPRQFLSAIDRDHRKPFVQGSGRLELARAIGDRSNPLTARVMVNRVWQHHFGAGLVRTPGDFGMRSDPPTHPELLDWLSGEFVGDRQLARRASEGLPQLSGPPSLARRASQAWSLKRLHRLMLASRVYQQSSQSPRGFDADPENRLMSHANRSRLDFEATRDALLFVSGRLDDRLGGPSRPMLDGGFHPRRTLYATLDRLDPPSLLSVFDFPSLAATSASRDTTTVSPQALFLMNGPLVETVAQLIVERGEVIREPDTSSRVRHLTRILFARVPTAPEERLATEFLGSQPSPAAWQQFAQALLLTNEFVFVD